MATERQINANRANALKCTGPKAPEGKRISSNNAAISGIVSSTIVLKGESMRRYNDLAAALILQFQPRNSAETFLVQTMAAARWRLLRTWGIQTAGFEMEMAKRLARTSRVISLQHRLEVSYGREYHRALAMLLKLREAPGPNSDENPSSDPPLQIATETWDDDFQNETNFESRNSEESHP